ncbi:L-asparaginase [Flexibacter flexilis DSM 6793]|uniref:asparaginase n=1 Tax=Flexibacter flexilis DSM 6793 TaxID=927664 RepID=A0A1I1DI27_9BACT|nr:asparaginase [Flexibacter flexilis]SFB74571.1 L-asparaginase [Flexibacter flexilis DSM 6793]
MKRLFYKKIHYKTVNINTSAPKPAEASILVIYTGGTLGMVFDEVGKHLVPFDFEQILDKIPELSRFGFSLTVISFNQLIDSANVSPAHWIALATLIEENYAKYNGFVIIHGTDTMAYSASALSFLLENLNKPVILTGAQLPIGAVRTDARENLITALEIAAARKDGRPLVTEVCIYFNNKLLRGNRAKKVESAQFGAFESANYPALAECGIRIDYNSLVIKPYQPFSTLKVYKKMDTRVAILKLFPGVGPEIVESIINLPNLKGVVIETYGSGNAPTESWFIESLKKAINKGIIVYNVSQCNGGTVMQGRYETSKSLMQIGVLSGGDITTEAAVTKLMFLLGNDDSYGDVKRNLTRAIRGEMTV